MNKVNTNNKYILANICDVEISFNTMKNFKTSNLVIVENSEDDIYFLNYKSEKIPLNKAKNIKRHILIFNLNLTKLKNDIKTASRIIKKIKKLENIIIENNLIIGQVYDKNKIYLGTLKSKNNKYDYDILTAIAALFIKNRKEKIEFLYDRICDRLDDIVIKSNICGFKNDKCIAKANTNCTMGCCHHYKNKILGIFFEKDLKLCEYQKDKRCTAKCITCKMYMCDFLVKKGYKFTCQNVLLIKIYFNLIQKIIIKTSFFTRKDKIIKRLTFFDI